MCNQCILFFTDIESLVHVIYKQSCKDKSLMLFVRKLVSICLTILFSKLHIYQGFATSSLMLCLAHRCTLFGNIVTMLASCSPQPSSIPTYKRAWRLFHQFLHAVFQTVSPILPVSPNTIALVIAYMFDKQYAPSTVSSYVSALSFAHKFLGFDDPTKAFFVTQILKGYHKQGSRLDSRLPITLTILHKLLDSACKLAICRYQVC